MRWVLLVLAMLAAPVVASAQQAETSKIKPFAAVADIHQPIEAVWQVASDQSFWPTLVASLFGPSAPPIEIEFSRETNADARRVIIKGATLDITLTLRATAPNTTSATCKVSDAGDQEAIAVGILKNLANAAKPTLGQPYAWRPIDKPAERPPSYAAYMGAAEGVSQLIGIGFLAGWATQKERTILPFFIMWPVVTSVAVPIVHLARKHPERARLSFLMRSATWVLGLEMIAIGENHCHTYDCKSSVVGIATTATLLGLVMAMTVDYAFLSREPKKGSAMSLVLSPGGVAGTF